MKNKKKLYLMFLCMAAVILACSLTVKASGLVDDTISSAHEYSRFPILNYQLDFFVDKSWSWLPWNWNEGFGKTIAYGLYSITNMLWIIILYFSNFVGFLVEQAFKLDFISSTADIIGKNIQLLTGVSPQGFSNTGFFVSSFLLIVFVMGVYITYIGLFKRQTTKVFQSVISFVLIGVLSTSFFAFAPAYIKNVNDFSNDLAGTALNIGAKLVLPNSGTEGEDSVAVIRDSLFSLMVRQPWLLLQFDDTDENSIGMDRVNNVLGKSAGEDREAAVKDEIEQRNNGNLTITGVLNRLAVVMLLLVFNLIISFFVLSLCGIMIFTQILFIIYAVFLPLSLIIALLPGQQNVAKKFFFKLFNIIINRAGISLVISLTFCVSTMIYSMTKQFPFLLVLFLQLLLFIGVYTKLNEILGVFSLQSNEMQQAKGQFRRGYSKLRHMVHFMQMRSMTSMLRDKKSNDDKPNESASSANQPRNKISKATGGRENVNGSAKKCNTLYAENLSRSANSFSNARSLSDVNSGVKNKDGTFKDKPITNANEKASNVKRNDNKPAKDKTLNNIKRNNNVKSSSIKTGKQPIKDDISKVQRPNIQSSAIKTENKNNSISSRIVKNDDKLGRNKNNIPTSNIVKQDKKSKNLNYRGVNLKGKPKVINLGSKYHPVAKYIKDVNYNNSMSGQRFDVRKANLRRNAIKQTTKRRNTRNNVKNNNRKKR